ncbi:MAG: hypothetical protein OEW35_00655 [Gammaproteobacteria bacterium]|nr:hypothetical protein [Gammaproteobacteria bacterium]MDH5309897.1 hypothetical protein [Gammaproteobacteria bacterium]
MTSRARQIIALILLGGFVTGCAQTEDWLRGRRTATPSDPVILGAPSADSYLQDLHALATGDPYTQVEIFSDAESAARLTPGPSTELRFALVLATPGHAETDPQRAQSMLREILSQTELLTTAEIALATITLRSVEERLTLDAESRRLRAENAQARTTETDALARRIATVEAENRDLREQLTEAEQKLEAIMSIERSLRERSDNPN